MFHRGPSCLAALVLVASAHAQPPGAGAFEPPPLCPAPLESEPRWAALALGAETRVVWTEPELESLARVLASDLRALTGLEVDVAPKPARSRDIVLTLGYLPEEYRANPESYFVEVLDHVLLSGQTAAGVAQGTARLLQLVTQREVEGEARWSVPPVRMVDAPALPWRILEPVAPALASVAAAERAVRVAHLAGFNAVAVDVLDEALAPDAPERAVLAALERAAAARQVRLVGRLRGSAQLLAGPTAPGCELYLLPGNEVMRPGTGHFALVAAAVMESLPESALLVQSIPLDADWSDARMDSAWLRYVWFAAKREGLGLVYHQRFALDTPDTAAVAWRASDREDLAGIAAEGWRGRPGPAPAPRAAARLAAVVAAIAPEPAPASTPDGR